ncbi:angiopoietin-related protein 6 isoform X2 [Anguilla anguilla]|uniref:angiopoietin-related protein 6 isoform X2 n=1 Tax=Anguilla anguilla TaxID=7936 RepID=UPI0015B07368|nr:angiopoietin-related protein 6 isoform X2 [Anguilla anguilla]
MEPRFPAVVLVLLASVRFGLGKEEESRPEPKGGRCSYTFIVPQQRLTGALCVSTRAEGANCSELAALRVQVGRQQEQLDRVRALLEQDGGLAAEVRALRRESGDISGRITQIYAQLLHDLIHKKDHALEQRRLENLLLNATAQVLQVSARYGEMDRKYEALSSLVNNQSLLITQLEAQCQQSHTQPAPLQQVTSAPSLPQPKEPQSDSAAPGKTANDIQRDQSPSLSQQDPPSTRPYPSTDPPFSSYPVTKTPGPWQDCQHALESGESTSGIYLLRPRNANRLIQAWCEQDPVQGGWTVVQRRQDGSVNFFRTWDQYKQGFGNLNGEYWLGLEHLYWLSTQAEYRLRVALEDWQGRQVFAEYDRFRLEPESDWYRLRLGQYHGSAGDSLSWHNNRAFTTLDRDRDAYTGNCAHYQKGGWWYHMCAHSNLNGVWYRGGHYRSRYQDGVYWTQFHGGSYSLKRATMMIKPV